MTVTLPRRACVLVFAGHDPSGGAGIQADIEAIAAQGAHALPVITALTVQDHNRVLAVHPVDSAILLAQALALQASCIISSVKIGIVGSRQNAATIADFIRHLWLQNPTLQVVLDPVLGSGAGDELSVDDAILALRSVMAVATILTPNLPEVRRLSPHLSVEGAQARHLLSSTCQHVLLKGGHGLDERVINRWYSQSTLTATATWSWPRLSGEFHGSGCTLAAAIAGQLAIGRNVEQSFLKAQEYTHQCLIDAYSIGDGQKIPDRKTGKVVFDSREMQREFCRLQVVDSGN